MRWRFSLRWLLIVVTVVSLGFAWFAYELRLDRIHRLAIEELQRNGCSIGSATGKRSSWLTAVKRLVGTPPARRVSVVRIPPDMMRASYNPATGLQTSLPDQLELIVGNLAQLRHPEEVDLYLEDPSDFALAALAECSALAQFHSIQIKIDLIKLFPTCTPESLACVRVTSLQAAGSEFTDEHLLALGPSPDLKAVSMNGTGVTSEGIAAIAQAPNLEYISLRSHLPPAELLASVPEIDARATLYLDGINLSGADLGPIANLPQLKILSLKRSYLTAVAMETLTPLPQLRKLNLTSNEQLDHVSDDLLARLPGLKNLDVSWTGLSLADCEHIRQRFPKIKLKCEGIFE